MAQRSWMRKGEALLPLKKRILRTIKFEGEVKKTKTKAFILPPKKRKRFYTISVEGHVKDHEEQYKEMSLPLKKRKSVYSLNWNDQEKGEEVEKKNTQEEVNHVVIEEKGEEVEKQYAQENIKQVTEEVNHVVIDEKGEKVEKQYAEENIKQVIQEVNHVVIEDEVEATHVIIEEEVEAAIETMHSKKGEVEEENMKEKEDDGHEHNMIKDKEDENMGTQVSNPITLIAIAASWFSDVETLNETGSDEMQPLPEAYVLLDAFKKSKDDQQEKSSMELAVETAVNMNIEVVRISSSSEGGGSADEVIKEQAIENKEIKKRCSKPRSRRARRPNPTYTNFTSDFACDWQVISKCEEREEWEDEEEELDGIEETDGDGDGEDGGSDDDLYSKVKKRRGRIAKRSRCTRVNGKGWRCSRRTRAGYALCDHHLKRQERLRQLSNLRNNPMTTEENEMEENEEEEPRKEENIAKEPKKRGRKKGSKMSKNKFGSLKRIHAQTVSMTSTWTPVVYFCKQHMEINSDGSIGEECECWNEE